MRDEKYSSGGLIILMKLVKIETGSLVRNEVLYTGLIEMQELDAPG